MRRARKATTLAVLVLALTSSRVRADGLKVVIREWDVPTPDSRPHDPEVAPDGALWYTGQQANKLGRLDPKTGAIREFSLKTPESGPHGLAADKDGNIWFTANYKPYIGRLDPSTGEVTEYPMPDARVRDPHSLVFDRDGRIFFTAQQSNFVGRLDPKSGKVKTFQKWPIPSGGGVVRNMVATPDGKLYLACSGVNKVAIATVTR